MMNTLDKHKYIFYIFCSLPQVAELLQKTHCTTRRTFPSGKQNGGNFEIGKNILNAKLSILGPYIFTSDKS